MKENNTKIKTSEIEEAMDEIENEQPSRRFYKVTVPRLNVRERPSIESKVIDVLYEHAAITVVESDSDWAKLSGQGWVMVKYIEEI